MDELMFYGVKKIVGSCSSEGECLSRACRGGYCCNEKVAEGCVACDPDGDCMTCGKDYYLDTDKCLSCHAGATSPVGSESKSACKKDTGSCSRALDCTTGVCRGGFCCSKKGVSEGCIKCFKNGGACKKCTTKYDLRNFTCVNKDSGSSVGSCDGGSECATEGIFLLPLETVRRVILWR